MRSDKTIKMWCLPADFVLSLNTEKNDISVFLGKVLGGICCLFAFIKVFVVT